MKTTSFRQLEVWKKAHQLVLAVYKQTRAFPDEERYGLSVQMRRCAVSVPANIAEGYGRRSLRDKVRMYNISESSLEELKYYLILTEDLEYGPTASLFAVAEEVSRMLRGYTDAIRSST